MDASSQQPGHCIAARDIACWLLICALSWSAGCAGTGSKATGSQVTSNSVFRNPFGKKPAREVIDPDAGFDEYDVAMAKFNKKEYDAAAKEFKVIAKKFYDYPVEEDAMFMVGECHFAQQRYAHAQDDYDGMIKKFPSSRYLEKSTRRLYTIAAIWLNGDGSTKTDELIQVSSTDVTTPEKVERKPIPHSMPLVPNFFDKTRPLFDTPGNARKALKSVWLHDPLGPLADDALMMTAVYHIRKGQLRDADHYLDVLRREYPKSEHTQAAFVVGSHIKLASYQGPRYDGRDLVDADDLIHSTLNLYPDLPDREGLQGELVKIKDQGAERLWSRVEYYNRRMKPQSEVIYLESILKDFPESPVAEKAAKRLKELGPKYWTGMLDHYPDPNSDTTPKSSSKAKPPASTKTPEGPQFPRKRPAKSAPQTQEAPADEELPPTKPRTAPNYDDSGESYEELPPAKTTVDPPELVDGPSDEEIERTAFEPPSGRAKP
ncbi:MAG: tetratricopeptide repeat protein [Planctomycetota bacterium]